ncbi:hypothetical protein DTW91_02585 [Chryseobacterium sp. SC28]|nr:hypothetical protein DTW91_02585 [Chryseobacterium sp. SC28]
MFSICFEFERKACKVFIYYNVLKFAKSFDSAQDDISNINSFFMLNLQPYLSVNPFLWLKKLDKKIGILSPSLRTNYRRK